MNRRKLLSMLRLLPAIAVMPMVSSVHKGGPQMWGQAICDCGYIMYHLGAGLFECGNKRCKYHGEKFYKPPLLMEKV